MVFRGDRLKDAASDSLVFPTRFGTYSTDAAINHGLDLEMCVFPDVEFAVALYSADARSIATFVINQAGTNTMARDPDTGLAQL